MGARSRDAQRADGECPVVPFDQEVIEEARRPAKQFRGAPQTFDEHISRLVTTRIEWLAKQYT